MGLVIHGFSYNEEKSEKITSFLKKKIEILETDAVATEKDFACLKNSVIAFMAIVYGDDFTLIKRVDDLNIMHKEVLHDLLDGMIDGTETCTHRKKDETKNTSN